MIIPMEPVNSNAIPVISVTPLLSASGDKRQMAREIQKACRGTGFFYIRDHGIEPTLIQRLENQSARFFALPQEVKMKIAMKHGGIAWRGYFPVGGELTSGKPDQKEGMYFGEELGNDHPAVVKKLPLHGKNLFPSGMPEFQKTVLEYMGAMTVLCHALMRGISLSLDLDENYFHDHFTKDPLTLFRIFNYPKPQDDGWGVGEHTDYGVLTVLLQDTNGGLEVKSKSGWVAAPPIPGTFVCNIGDMLDRMTRGLYRSTPHRVKNKSGKDRVSFPFFFDPGFHTLVKPLPLTQKFQFEDDKELRWDGQSVHTFQGTYGDYLIEKVSKVFPELKKRVF